MTVLLVNRFCWPDRMGSGKILTELAEDLAAAGHAVSVVSSSAVAHDPGHVLAGFEVRSAVRYHRVPTCRFNRTQVFGWFLNALSFYPWALLRILLLPAHAVTVFLTDPPLLFVLGPLVRHLKKTRVVVWSQDLYPDVAMALGVMSRGSFWSRLFTALSASALRSADSVIALGEQMKGRLLAKGVEAARISVVHNWADGAVMHPESPSTRPFGLQDEFVVMYSGNFGLSHEFTTLLAAARMLRSRHDIQFLFVGTGKQWASVKALAGGTNARFYPFQEEAHLSSALSAAGVQIVSLKAGLEGMLVPSKVYGCLAVGRPVVYVGGADSEVADIVRSSQCGFVVRPGDVDALVASIVRLADSVSERASMGARARRAFESSWDRKIGTARLRAVLEAAAGPP